MRYENKSGTHRKFYEIDVIPGPEINGVEIFAVIAKWGKIGTRSPRTEPKKTGSFKECYIVMETLIKKRLKNGYVKIKEPEKRN